MLFGISDRKVKVIYWNEFKKTIKSGNLLVNPKVIAKFFEHAASNPEVEKAGVLIGRFEGKSLVCDDMRPCMRAESTAATVRLNPQEIIEIDKSLGRHEAIIGWAHAHPKYGIFLSGTDKITQSGFQNMFADAIAMVLDPFSNNGRIDFGFFRLVDGECRKLDYTFLVEGNPAVEEGDDEQLVELCGGC